MPDYPERAVLEGLVNALIHRNYLEVGSEVHVDMFDDRLEIYSPGGMYDGTKVQERDLMKVPSRRRNPIIADIFNRLKYMDRRGSGFKKILGDYRNQPNYDESYEPKLYSDANDFFLVLKNMNYKKGAEKRAEKGAEKGAELKERAENVYRLILGNRNITQTMLMSELNLSRKKVEKAIEILRKQGKIERMGSDRNGSWIVK